MSNNTLVSVIIPVYNESATFLKLLKKVLSIKIDKISFQIIIVESQSTDGTREQVESLIQENFDIVYQNQALGKGSAVIEGFKKVKGEIVLIQDSDLEYDPQDYHIMLKPILNNETDFVLGARIKKGFFNMRTFKNNYLKSIIFNISHLALTLSFNLLYNQKLKDPWTCYKVFRGKCLDDIQLNCLGFDFDMELLCKLVKKGYEPTEVPVSYVSRSHAEGKKVSIISDGPKVIFTLIKNVFI